MRGRVIQGFFIGGVMPVHAARRVSPGSAAPARGAGAPAAAFAGRAASVQARMAPGRPPLAHQGAGHFAQPRGGNGNFAIDPAQLGLMQGGGRPLPQAVLAKMEAAFGADFSDVRVHIGPQASRIGAVAFTTGNDLYFAPGQFQPDSIKGQQLIGHELAHVIQQRQGRVRAPGNGVAVVQDRMLEAEADRLGMRAAAHRPPAQPQTLQRKGAGARGLAAIPRPGPPMRVQRKALAVQRCIEMENTGPLDYNGDLIGRDTKDPEVVALLTDLGKRGYNTAMLEKVEELIEAAPVFVFSNPAHLENHVKAPHSYPPTMTFDDDSAQWMDELAGDFGSAFKGPTIKFSGSRVYSVAYSEKDTSLWAMLNSATGHIGAKEQGVVKTWSKEHLPYSFPSNTLKLLRDAKLTRPTVMPGNAHAEVNQIVHHAIRAIAKLHKTPHDVQLMFGSDIKHCAECYWAAHAVWKKAGVTGVNYTGCGNRLFERWREPWTGFYAEYGDNPFRKPNGDFRTGFDKGEYTATKLNSKVSGSVGNIYV